MLENVEENYVLLTKCVDVWVGKRCDGYAGVDSVSGGCRR